MTTIKENDVVSAIMDYLIAHKIFVFRINNTPIYDPRGKGRFRRKGKYERYGVSDILGMFDGRMLAIEVKRQGGKPSDYQLEFINDVQRYGGIAFVAYSVEDVINNLSKYARANTKSPERSAVGNDTENR
jgi:penicillin-binding protein-related factor A (putative recombinase)